MCCCFCRVGWSYVSLCVNGYLIYLMQLDCRSFRMLDNSIAILWLDYDVQTWSG
jgi:hypothetical protein